MISFSFAGSLKTYWFYITPVVKSSLHNWQFVFRFWAPDAGKQLQTLSAFHNIITFLTSPNPRFEPGIFSLCGNRANHYAVPPNIIFLKCKILLKNPHTHVEYSDLAYFSIEHHGVLAVSRGVGVGVVEWSGHGLNADEPQGASQRVVMLCGSKTQVLITKTKQRGDKIIKHSCTYPFLGLLHSKHMLVLV